jgi:hypothetical protein
MWSRNKKLKRRNLLDSLGEKEEEIDNRPTLIYNGLLSALVLCGKIKYTNAVMYLWIPLKEGIGGGRRPKDRVKKTRVTLWITLLSRCCSELACNLSGPFPRPKY